MHSVLSEILYPDVFCMFLSSLKRSCRFFPSSTQSRAGPLAFCLQLETMYWGEAAARFWSYIIQMGASLLFAATLCLWNNSPKLPFEDGLRLYITSRKQTKWAAHSRILGSFIIFRWCCQRLRSLEQQCRTSPPGAVQASYGIFSGQVLVDT